MAIITVENLSKQFPGEPRAAVDRASFEVEAGSFVVLIGPSGCGKTTLLKMLNRLYEPTSGRVLMQGRDAQGLPATELRREIGYVIQQTGLFPHMRISQNIAVVPELLGWERARIDTRVGELIDLIGLPREYGRRYPRQLSGGQQQRVGLARALAADPAIMLMDEPFGALDAITRTRLQDELIAIQRRLKKTILFVTHDMEEALRLADKVVVMCEGKIVQYDTPLHIVTNPANEFVEDLVGASDMLRRLSLINATMFVVERQLGGDEPSGEPSIGGDASLRDAISALVGSASDSVGVRDGSGARVGRLTFDDIRRALVPSEGLGARV
ncbi:MAG: ABC transporter ATP-binding protein [Roseiflexaceae bacterium]|nr:ABC transporter ATP-binding protein [Roseiflexaceae bacterium]